MVYSNLTFLNKYRKDELVKYIASLHLYAQNSSHVLQLSTLMYEALACKGGRKHVDVAEFSRDVMKCYSHDINEDPQEYLFVDCVHTPEGSYRVFPGIFTYLQYNLTRLFEVAEDRKIDKKVFGEVYALLDISDLLAEKCGLGRYERGMDEFDKLYCSNHSETSVYQGYISFNHQEIAKICVRHGIKCEDARKFICRPKAKDLRRFLMMEDCYSPIETTPFYRTEADEYIVIQPSALLSCAYLTCLKILRKIIQDEEFNNIYLEIMMADVIRAIKHSDRLLRDKKTFRETGCLLYNFDKGKAACILVNHHGFNADNDEKIAREYAQESFPNAEIFYVKIHNSLDFEPIAFGAFDCLTLSIEDFELMMRQEDMSLLNLYHYYKSRYRLNNVIGSQEIDMFAYYLMNRHSFHHDSQPTFSTFCTGTAFDMRCNYYQSRDYHLIDGMGGKIMIEHNDDFPKEIPCYVPSGSGKYPIIVGEYNQSRVIFFWDSRNPVESGELREVCKSLMVWIYAFEYRFGVSLLKDGDYPLLVSYCDDEPKIGVTESKKIAYEFPRVFFDRQLKHMTHEKVIFEFFLEGLEHHGYLSVSDVKAKMNLLFSECHGQQLQIDINPDDLLMSMDQYRTNYRLNEHEMDIIEDEIANYINCKGEKKILTIEESKNVAVRIIGFVEQALNNLLSGISNIKFLRGLMELHHATLYWKHLTQKRFEKVNKLYDYVGADYSEQINYIHSYDEINNLTMCLIERIVSKDLCDNNAEIEIETTDKAYAYMAKLFLMGSYKDYLNEITDGMEMAIMEDGRIVLPNKALNLPMTYFSDMRAFQMYHQEAFRKLAELRKEDNVDLDDPIFREAFKDEYSIDFMEWVDVITKCIEYAGQKKDPVIVMSEQAFDNEILLKVMKESEIGGFKEAFVMSKDMINEKVSPYESYVQRFNRKFQLTSRPWVRYGGKIIFSTKSLWYSYGVINGRLEKGKIKAQSEKMRSLKGRISGKKGRLFNQMLYDLYSGLNVEGLVVDKEVKIGPKERIKYKESLGDIDVLLIHKVKKLVVCIEAKDYVECTTVYELLSQFQKIKEDREIVGKRDEWAKSHLMDLKCVCKDIDEDYKVKTFFITSSLPVQKYIDMNEDDTITFISALEVVEKPMVVFE